MKSVFAVITVCCALTTAAAQSALFTIQVESLRNQAAAVALVAQLRSSNVDAYYLKATVPGKGELYRVRVGRFATRSQARELGEKLRRAGLIRDYFVARYEDSSSSPIAGTSQTPSSQTASSATAASTSAAASPRPLSERARVEFEARYWITNLKGLANISGGLPGTDVNLKSDLGLKDNNFPEARFIWHINRKRKLKLDYTQISYGGNNILQRTINFGGNTYNVNARVISSLEVKQLKFGYVWQSFNIKDKVKFGPQFEFRGLWIKSSADAPNASPPIRESHKLAIPLPSIGLDLDVYPHRRFRFFAAVSGTPAGKYGHFLDGEAGMEFFPVENVRVIGGFRILDLRGRNEPDFANLRLSGPFVGAGIRF